MITQLLVLALLPFPPCLTSTLPKSPTLLTLPSDNPNPSPSPLTARVPPWIPPTFAALSTIARGAPMNSTGMYANAIEAMYSLITLNQSSPIPAPRHWSLPEYDLLVEVSAAEVRFAVWGLGATCQTNDEEGYFPMITRLSLGGVMKGFVSIRYRNAGGVGALSDGSLGRELMASNSSASVDDAGDMTGSLRNDTSTLELKGNADFDVNTTATGRPLAMNYALQACISTMSYAAQFNKNDPLTAFNLGGAVIWVSAYDADRKPYLRARHVWKVMRLVARNMIQDGFYGELNIDLTRNGVKIATAKLKANEQGGEVGRDTIDTAVA